MVDLNATAGSDKLPAHPQKRRWLLWSAFVTCYIFMLLAIAVSAALYTERGSRALWQLVASSMAQTLGGEWQGGTFSRGLQLRNVYYKNAEHDIRIDSINSQWHISISPLTLTVSKLHISKAKLNLLPAPDEPLVLPDTIHLPLSLQLKANVGQLVVNKDGAEFAFNDIALMASSDKIHHNINLEVASTPAGAASLRLALNGDRPFMIESNARFSGNAKQENYLATAHINGSLKQMRIMATLQGDKVSGKADILATPFDTLLFKRAIVDIRQLNLAAFNPAAPRTDLSINTQVVPLKTPVEPAESKNANLAASSLEELSLVGPVTIRNKIPGSIDKQLLPVISMTTTAHLDTEMQQLKALSIKLLGGGQLTGSAQHQRTGSGNIQLQAMAVNVAALHGALQPTSLKGPVVLDFTPGHQRIKLDLSDRAWNILADAQIDQSKINLNSGRLQSGPAQVDVSGSMMRDTTAAYALIGKLSNFNPALFLTNQQPSGAAKPYIIPAASINSDFRIEGMLKPELIAKANFNIHDSQYGQSPMLGKGVIHVVGKQLRNSDIHLTVAGNSLAAKGAYGTATDKLYINVDAPALDKLGFGMSGSLKLDGNFAGSIDHPEIHARFAVRGLTLGQHKLATGSGQIGLSGSPTDNRNASIQFDLDAQGYSSTFAQLDSISTHIAGSYAAHSMRFSTKGRVRGEKLDMVLAAQGRLQQTNAGMEWNGLLNQFDNAAIPRLHLQTPLSVIASQHHVKLGAAAFSVENATLQLKYFDYQAEAAGQPAAVRSEGAFNGLDIAHLLKLRQQLTGVPASLNTSLVLDADWNFDVSQQGHGFVQVKRRDGDISIPLQAGDTALGISKLQLRAELHGNNVDVRADIDSRRIGNLQGNAQLALQSSGALLGLDMQAPLSGHVIASMPELAKLGAFAGPRISLDGRLRMDIALGGTIANTELSGQINGDALALTLYDQGIRLREGTARMMLHDNVIDMQNVEFHGGKGVLRIVGSIPIDKQRPQITATVIADKLELLADPSSLLTLSGEAKVSNLDQSLQVAGKFIVDNAMFSLPETTAPKLGDDVVIVRNSEVKTAKARRKALAQKPASPYSPAVDIDVDLGKDFRFKGLGTDLRLVGLLNVKSEPGKQPDARGTIRVAEGTFEAFGTKLAIERGIINFQGSLDNPGLNILAMRRKQEIPAGVQVTGTADHPQVTLVSEPEQSNEQKLSWLVFGRASGGNEQGQAQAAAQGAALALVNSLAGGNSVAKRVGLDEISLATGTSGQQMLNLGKKISQNLSLGYRQGLTSAESGIELTYLLSQHWSVVTRGGRVLGLNIVYSNRFDRINSKK